MDAFVHFGCAQCRAIDTVDTVDTVVAMDDVVTIVNHDCIIRYCN